MLTIVIAFIIDVFIPKLLNVDECSLILRNLFHLIATPFVLLAYSFVEFYALHEVIIFGKKGIQRHYRETIPRTTIPRTTLPRTTLPRTTLPRTT
ncbi:unnamed protein product, partial [Didymodactylos carnosus]